MQIGPERVVLDAPPGFADTSFLGSPRMREFAESLTSASNRILLFALTDADLRRFMAGERLELRRYLIAVTPRELERARVSQAEFSAYVNESLRALGPPPGSTGYLGLLERQPQGKASLLAELRRDPQVVSVLQGMRVPAAGLWGEKPKYLLATTTLLLLRGKALQLAAYTDFEDDADPEWLRLVTQRWVDELLRLNSR